MLLLKSLKEVFSFMEFRQLPPSKEKRQHHAAIMFNDYIYLFGGHNGSEVVLSCEGFNLASQDWECIPPLLQSSHFNMASIVNEKILISGYHISRVYSFDGNDYQFSLNLAQNQFKILMGNFVIINGALFELRENVWIRHEQNMVNPSFPLVQYVAKRGDFYYCHESAPRIIRLNAGTRALDAFSFF